MTYQPSGSEELAARIESLLGRLQKDAEKRGWKFYIHPPPHVIPEFLEGYCPDALGIGPDGGVVIEINARRHETPIQSVAKIASLIEAQKGWDYRVFTYHRSTPSRTYLLQRPVSWPPVSRRLACCWKAVTSERRW